MALSSIEQLQKLFQEAKNILILLPQNPAGDVISSAWALSIFFKKQKIKNTIAVTDPIGKVNNFNFLPQPAEVKNDIIGARDFVLSFKTTHNKIINIKTEEKKEETRIYITPEHGAIDPRDFSFIPSHFKYDVVIGLGSPDKESFGKVFEDNPDIFYEIPVVNIDNHSDNSSFGQINIVDITASSVSEILYGILKKIDENFINEDIALCFLSGIISATDSFQNKNTKPKALQISAELIDKGADQQKIIRHLYKTQPFNTLKLWGRIMAGIKQNKELKLVWAFVSLEDFIQTKTSPQNIYAILNKIQRNYSPGETFIILYNKKQNEISGIAKSTNKKTFDLLKNMYSGHMRGEFYHFKLGESSADNWAKKLAEKVSN